jgi:predicted nucleic acid-binding protein
VILLDTSGLLAAIDGGQRHHAAAARSLKAARAPLLLSPFVLAELDYLLATRVGLNAELALLGEVARGAYQLATFSADDVAAASEVMERYLSLELGLADASIVVLAERHGITDVLSLDERHFRAITPASGMAFRILPLDA